MTLAISSVALSGCELAEGHLKDHLSAGHHTGDDAEGEEAAADGHAAGHTEGHTEGHAGGHAESRKIIVTSPRVQDVVNTRQYVCQLHSRRHIEIRALEGGYLLEVNIQEGQKVKAGDQLFKIQPVLLKAKLDSELAEVELARIKVKNTEKLVRDNVVSDQELALANAELAKVEANAALARAELAFTDVAAPFDGIVDRQMCQQGSLIEEGDNLTTLSDNSVMWAYFNMPEVQYLEYMSGKDKDDGATEIELVLANGNSFSRAGKIGAIEADFDSTTGNIAFRADFENPTGVLRHGQTGTVKIHRPMKDVIVIPQRCKYEILAKQYVFVVDKDNVVRQREITVQKELEDLYVVSAGLTADDRIIFEGVRQVRDGDKIEFEYREPDQILGSLKYHAE
ncbi:MAG: efflux RND transporter periplasmic adaptor subunit [Planctomycetaceae bacterium]